jgi:succinate dehydrogenase/fumarate reductase-like Fe-S protein
MATKKTGGEKARGRAAAAAKQPARKDASEAGPRMIDIYIMGKQYEVPEGLTIQKALEYAGMRLLRGCGCRGGFCGACGTVYRTEGDYKLKVALACQTVVEEGMHLTQIPFYPGNKALYDIEDLAPTLDAIVTNYPEVMRCLQCNSCRKVCPQDIEVMQYIAAAMRGDVARLADLSFDCIMCGLCASRCPGELVQYYIGILGRRLYGKYLAPKAEHVAKRIDDLGKGKFDKDVDNLVKMKKEDLKKLYDARDIEPEDLTGEPAVAASSEISD